MTEKHTTQQQATELTPDLDSQDEVLRKENLEKQTLADLDAFHEAKANLELAYKPFEGVGVDEEGVARLIADLCAKLESEVMQDEVDQDGIAELRSVIEALNDSYDRFDLEEQELEGIADYYHDLVFATDEPVSQDEIDRARLDVLSVTRMAHNDTVTLVLLSQYLEEKDKS